MKKGYFISFEGAEGSGKSTQIRRAQAYLRKKRRKTLVLREPGGTRVSEAIRSIILNKRYKEMFPETELLLYLSARAQIVRERIMPALKKGYVVICDRYEDSTLSYQGYGRGIPVKRIAEISRGLVRMTVKPRLTFLLDIDPVKGLARGGRHDRMEKESLGFHRKVRRGFLDLARREPRRFMILDGLADRGVIAKQIEQRLSRVIR